MGTPRRQLATDTSGAVVDEIDRLRTAILAAVSHDLRTPLTSIKAAAGSLLSREVRWTDDAVRTFCEQIDHEADRLDARIGNLLDMSRIQSGALHPHIEPIDVAEVVETAIAGVTRDIEHVVVQLEASLAIVRADRILLNRALSHLIDNALKWSPTHQAWVFADQRGRRVRLCVRDDGPGISPQHRDQIFRPFQRLDDGPTTKTNGIGLGLAVARGLVEAMGGTLKVADTPCGGTTMVIELAIASQGRAVSERRAAVRDRPSRRREP
jgi:two-component system sensor histidine kinase KdpD